MSEFVGAGPRVIMTGHTEWLAKVIHGTSSLPESYELKENQLTRRSNRARFPLPPALIGKNVKAVASLIRTAKDGSTSDFMERITTGRHL